MKLLDHYDGSDDPFEGDVTLMLRSLPVGARIKSATISLTPVDASGDGGFAETIAFSDGAGSWGAHKTANDNWVEVDFHARRTLAGVKGRHLATAELQVDLGGAYVELNDKGAIKTPPDDAYALAGDDEPLPGLTVAKFKLTRGGASPDIERVLIRSAPSNVHVRLAGLAPVWTHVGELTTTRTSGDVGEVLQAALAGLDSENGYYLLPVTVHSDSIARLKVGVAIDYALAVDLLPSGLSEVSLPFAYDTVANAQEGLLKVDLPSAAVVVAGETTAQVAGAFEESRIVFGRLGAIDAAGEVRISPGRTQAQPLALDEDLGATAVDLLLAAVTRTATLNLDIRQDLDGKPSGATLLEEPVQVALDREAAGRPTWVSVALPREFQFQAQRTMRYWLVLESVEGEVVWLVNPAPPGGSSLQRTDNGGLSWRASTTAEPSGPLAGLFRLRQRPPRYRVPIALEVGSGTRAQRVALDRFEPLGRVEFTLDLPEVAQAFNDYLRQTPPGASLGAEHVADGGFEHWLRAGAELAGPAVLPLRHTPVAVGAASYDPMVYVATSDGDSTYLERFEGSRASTHTLIAPDILGSPERMAISDDGRRIYLAVHGERARLHVVDTESGERVGDATDIEHGAVTDMTVSPDGARLYVAQYFYVAAVNEGRVVVYDTAAPGGDPAFIPIGSRRNPGALATYTTEDDAFLLVLVSDEQQSNQNLLYRYETSTRRISGAPLRLGRGGGGLAASPCGGLAVAGNADDRTLSIIDLAQWKVLGAAIPLPGRPRYIALSADAARAYTVLARGAGTSVAGDEWSYLVGVVDTQLRGLVETGELDSSVVDMAIAGDGGRLFIPLARADSVLAVVPTAARVPVEWAITSGHATGVCFGAPFGQVAALGIRDLGAEPVPSTLAQVVPVTAGCDEPYRFSFWAASSHPGARAEIDWIDPRCERLGTDTIPIRRARSREGEDVITAPYPVPSPGDLVLHSTQLTPPAGAAQAEIRFRDAGGIVVLDGVALTLTAAESLNSALRLDADGRPFGWTLPTATGALVFEQGYAGMRLSNVGAEAASLTQNLPVTGGQAFQLELLGSLAGAAPGDAPALAGVRWRDDAGNGLAGDIGLEVSAHGFEHHAAAGSTPAAASQAEVFIKLPPDTSIDVRAIALRQVPSMDTTATLLAHAPGELTLSNARIVYEIAGPGPVEIPSAGLCSPALPEPARTTEAASYCGVCGDIRGTCDMTTVRTPSGRPASAGTCRSCGATAVRLGGRLIPSAPALTEVTRRTTPRPGRERLGIPAAPRRRMPRVDIAEPVPHLVPIDAAVRDLSRVRGIGPVRAGRLVAARVTSTRRLAELAAQELERIIPRLSLDQAEAIVEEARRIALGDR